MAQEGKILPKWEPRKRPRLKETDAERQIAFSQEQRRARMENVYDSKRAAEDKLSKGPGRRAADSEDRMIVSRSVKRNRSRVRQSEDRYIEQKESHKQRESIKERGRGRRSRSVRRRETQDHQSREGNRSSRRSEFPKESSRNRHQRSTSQRRDSPNWSRGQRSLVQRRNPPYDPAGSDARRRRDKRPRPYRDAGIRQGMKRRRNRSPYTN